MSTLCFKFYYLMIRYNGLMVDMLDSGLSGVGLSWAACVTGIPPKGSSYASCCIMLWKSDFNSKIINHLMLSPLILCHYIVSTAMTDCTLVVFRTFSC